MKPRSNALKEWKYPTEVEERAAWKGQKAVTSWGWSWKLLESTRSGFKIQWVALIAYWTRLKVSPGGRVQLSREGRSSGSKERPTGDKG